MTPFRPCEPLDSLSGVHHLQREFALLSPTFRSLVLLHWRRVPPSTCMSSFVRLLHTRQADNTMASTRRRASSTCRPVYHLIENDTCRNYGSALGWAAVGPCCVMATKQGDSRAFHPPDRTSASGSVSLRQFPSNDGAESSQVGLLELAVQMVRIMQHQIARTSRM
jgi:hypothetical protein